MKKLIIVVIGLSASSSYGASVSIENAEDSLRATFYYRTVGQSKNELIGMPNIDLAQLQTAARGLKDHLGKDVLLSEVHLSIPSKIIGAAIKVSRESRLKCKYRDGFVFAELQITGAIENDISRQLQNIRDARHFCYSLHNLRLSVIAAAEARPRRKSMGSDISTEDSSTVVSEDGHHGNRFDDFSDEFLMSSSLAEIKRVYFSNNVRQGAVGSEKNGFFRHAVRVDIGTAGDCGASGQTVETDSSDLAAILTIGNNLASFIDTADCPNWDRIIALVKRITRRKSVMASLLDHLPLVARPPAPASIKPSDWAGCYYVILGENSLTVCGPGAVQVVSAQEEPWSTYVKISDSILPDVAANILESDWVVEKVEGPQVEIEAKLKPITLKDGESRKKFRYLCQLKGSDNVIGYLDIHIESGTEPQLTEATSRCELLKSFIYKHSGAFRALINPLVATGMTGGSDRVCFTDQKDYGGNYHFLYQGYPHGFTIHGRFYNSAEQYMMAQKAIMAGENDGLFNILRETDPSALAALGRNLKNLDMAAWDKTAEAVVYRGTLYKFTSSRALADELLATGDKELVFANTGPVWGIGHSDKEKAKSSQDYLTVCQTGAPPHGTEPARENSYESSG